MDAPGDRRTATSPGIDACAHERAHIVDSRFHGHSFSTAESRKIFCDVCRMQRWLDIEAALATSQAELGLIPREAGAAIAGAARTDNIDLDDVARGIRTSGHSLVPLILALQQAAGAEGEFVHHGATTQDIEDTGQVLEMREVLDVVDEILPRIVSTLVRLSRDHADTPMVGRTHTQPALPITFGAKTAGWLDEMLRQAERLAELRPRLLVAQLGGGAGTMAGFGPQGFELLSRFAERLSLGVPRSPWHTARDRVAEYVTTLAMLGATLARIADEIRTLSRPELGELEAGWEYGRVGSSTMPHKRNPDASSQVVVLARIGKAQALLGLDAMVQEHERDSRGLRLEWVAVAEISHCALGGLDILDQLLRDLTVRTDRMRTNLQSVGDLLCTERLMLELGLRIGKQTAHTVVYDITQRARDADRPLKEELLGSPEVTRCLSPSELDDILTPESYLGSAPRIVETVVSAGEEWLRNRRYEPS